MNTGDGGVTVPRSASVAGCLLSERATCPRGPPSEKTRLPRSGRYGQEPAPVLEEPLDAKSLLAAITDEDEETGETKALGENA